jgi:hypothetical protein
MTARAAPGLATRAAASGFTKDGTHRNSPPKPGGQANSSKPRLTLGLASVPSTPPPAAGKPAPPPGTPPAPPGAPHNPLRGLVAKLDILIDGRWPGALRTLMDVKQPKPFAIGIYEQIAAAMALAPAGQRRLKRVLASWTRHSGYLRALAWPSATRRGIDGRPTGQVAPEHQQRARDLLNACAAAAAPPAEESQE